MKQSYLPVRIVLGLVAAAHIIIGLIGVIPAVPFSIVLMFYGASLQVSPPVAHILQMFGAYMLTLGALGVYAFWDPVKNKSIIHCIIFLLLLRIIQRILFASSANTVFGIPSGYYWAQTAFFFLILLALVYFRPRTAKPVKA